MLLLRIPAAAESSQASGSSEFFDKYHDVSDCVGQGEAAERIVSNFPYLQQGILLL
ncbi:MAG: hypothetical protein U5P41_06290 [Gammaproteobacteria bacterium]|nr:hypothetical protein [Gammaproteobacteria bacterium]